MGFADLHIHSVYSWDGTSTIPAILKYAADFTSLDVIAITDHDCLEGAKEAVRLAPRYGIEVVPGCEISTADGHLLALFIEEPVLPGLSLCETVRQVGDQGGVCIAAHPGAGLKTSLGLDVIRQALKDPQVAQVLVGVESYNAGLVFNRSNRLAQELAQSSRKASIGSSDSHVLRTIGWGATEFAGFFAGDLRRALPRGLTRARRGRATSGLEKVYHWLPAFLLRRLGWVVDCANPNAALQLRRWKPLPRTLPETPVPSPLHGCP